MSDRESDIKEFFRALTEKLWSDAKQAVLDRNSDVLFDTAIELSATLQAKNELLKEKM